jgi:hypothetical protein
VSDASHDVRPHRGALILVFGILGILVCQILGIVAWVMANADLAAMERGEMDRDGAGMTTAGKVLGIISVVLAVLAVIAGIAIAIVMVGFSTQAR